MSNKFNQFGLEGIGDPTDGTLCLDGKSVTAGNFSPDSAVITDSNAKLQTTALATFAVAGIDKQIQFNDGGIFGANAAMTFDKGTQLVTFNVLEINANGNLQQGGILFVHSIGALNANIAAGARASLNIGGTTFGVVAVGALALRDNINTNNLTAVGASSQLSNTSGDFCTSVGAFSLEDNVTANDLTAVGFSSLAKTIQSGGTAVGALSLANNETGQQVSAVGASSLRFNVGGNRNTAMGWSSQEQNVSGNDNTTVGQGSLLNNVTGSECTVMGSDAAAGVPGVSNGGNITAIGALALNKITTAADVTAVGKECGTNITSGSDHVVMGVRALESITTGSLCVALGNHTLSDSLATGNVAVGHESSQFNIGSGGITTVGLRAGQGVVGVTTASSLTAVGAQALQKITTANEMTAVGAGAGGSSTSGGLCVFVGTNAGNQNTIGSSNTYVGARSAQFQLEGLRNATLGTNTMQGSGTTTDNLYAGSDSGKAVTTSQGRNVGLGSQSLVALTIGARNFAGGYAAGSAYTSSESDNIVVSNVGVVGDNTKIRIGTVGVHTGAFVAGVHSVSPAGATQTVVVDALGELGSTTQSMALPPGYVTGLSISDNTVAIKNISAGSCRDSTDTVNIVSAGVLSPDYSVFGANGVDVVLTFSDTWYAIFVIADTSGAEPVASLYSESATSPVLPLTYDVFRRVGWVRTNSLEDFYSYSSMATGRDRFYLWNEAETILEKLTNGGATTYTNIELEEFVPPTSQIAYINTNHVATGSQDFVTFTNSDEETPGSSPVANPRAHRTFSGSTGEASGSTAFFIRTNATQDILYGNSSAFEETDVWVLGYTDAL